MKMFSSFLPFRLFFLSVGKAKNFFIIFRLGWGWGGLCIGMSSALHLKHIIGQKKKVKNSNLKQNATCSDRILTPLSIRQETSRKSSSAQPRGFAFSSLIAESDSRYFIINVALFPLHSVVAAYFHYMKETRK